MKKVILSLSILLMAPQVMAEYDAPPTPDEVQVTAKAPGAEIIIKGPAAETLYKALQAAGLKNPNESFHNIIIGEGMTCREDENRSYESGDPRYDLHDEYTCIMQMVGKGRLVPGNPQSTF